MRVCKVHRILRAVVVLVVGAVVVPQAAWIQDSVGIIGYSVTLPPNYSKSTKYPLFFYLHAAGTSATEDGSWPHNNENEGDCKILASLDNQATYPCIVYAPQAPKFSLGEHWVNLPGSSAKDPKWSYGTYPVTTTPQSTCMRDALRGLDTMIARYSVDTNRIYIGGGSMGGYGTYDVLCRGYAGRFAGALPTSGAGDTSKAKIFKNLPIWAFADSSDGIIPFKFQVQMVEALKKAGGTPKYTFYSDRVIEASAAYGAKMGGHIWNIPFAIDPAIMPWIFAQKRSSVSTQQRELAHAPNATVRHTRSVVNLARTSAVCIRFLDQRNGTIREFDAQGRPVGIRQTRR